MSKIQVQVEVEKSVYDLMGALAKSISDVKLVMKVGGGIAIEAPAIAAALIANLAPIISELAAMPDDIKGDMEGAAEALAVQLPALVAALKG